MLKLGLVDPDDLPRMTTIFGRRRKVAVRVYGEILRNRSGSDRLLPLVLESLIVGPRAFKRTEDSRLAALDEVLFECIDFFEREPGGTLRVHDVGASDGRTSSELYGKLRTRGNVDFTASDLYRVIHVVEPKDGNWWFAFDEDQQLVQYGCAKFVLSPFLPDHPVLYPINRLVGFWLRHRYLGVARHWLAQASHARIPDLASISVGPCRVSSITLVCRECRDLMEGGTSFRFVRHDVREPSEEKYDLIRALNVFNQLDRAGQMKGLRSCFGSLREAGVLVIGRSVDPGGETRATVWRREAGGLRLLRDVAGGAEIKSLVPEALREAVS